jgi:hypothetical protein
MTVTSTAYTTSSYKITVSGEVVSNNIITAVNTAITSVDLGSWALHDGIAPSAVGASYTGAGCSPIWTNVYRKLNVDTTTYKYFIIRWDIIKNLFYTSTCEDWNNSTHAATNECWTGAGVFPQYYDIKDSFIFLSASAKHCVIWPYIKNEPGMWSGVFEFERVAGEDLAANTVPCFAWTNSLMLGTPYGRAAATTGRVMYAFPRTADGLTGAGAAQVYAPVTNRGMYPPNFTSGTVAITEPNMLHLGSYFSLTYGWDPTKTVASPVAADAITKSMPLGRMYNVGITKAVGSFLDTTYLNLDSTGGWPDAAGSNTEVLLLPLNGGSEANTTTGAQLQFSYGTATNVPLSKVIVIGSTAFAAANDGVRVWSVDSGTNTLTTSILSGQIITDVVFDGQDSVYAAGTTAVYRIQASNTANQSSVTLANATANGAGYLALDNNYLYITPRSANTSPLSFSIPRNNFLVANLTTYTPTTGVIVASGMGAPVPDYNGNFYVATQPGTAGATQTMRIVSFQSNTGAAGTQLFNLVNPIRPTAAASGGCNCNFWIDPTSGRIFLIAADATASAGTVYELNSSLVTQSTTAVILSNSTVANYNSGLAYSSLVAANAGDLRGDLVVQPIRGLFHIQPKRASGNTTATWSNKIHLISPTASTIGLPERIYANTAGSIMTDTASGASGVLFHNGPRTYLSDANTTSNNNLVYWRNYYSLNNINNATTGRLTIKG